MTMTNPFTPEELLANSRRISGDNADIAVKALGQLAALQQAIATLVETWRDLAILRREPQVKALYYSVANVLEAATKDAKVLLDGDCDHRGECTHIEAK
ncbi:hypothetical protein LCGC14_2770640 [marine sediment metagenome]|uniref:Uncharacterized protein n=1 Tax=marine sediment metagenome TaxID=412755 RepID=A0A0F8ZI25_9ZZZZ